MSTSNDYVLDFNGNADDEILSEASHDNQSAPAPVTVRAIHDHNDNNATSVEVVADHEFVDILEKHNIMIKDLMICIRKMISKNKKKKVRATNEARRPYNIFLTEKLPIIKAFRNQLGLVDQPKTALKLCRAMWKDVKQTPSTDLHEWMLVHGSANDHATTNRMSPVGTPC